MLLLQEIIEELNTMSCLELQQMANDTGVSYDTLISIRIGRNTNPRLNTVIAILGYLNEL